MATENNTKSNENNTSNKRHNGHRGQREKLVLLFGNEKGENISLLHAFIRPLIWAILWTLNGKLTKSANEKGEAKVASEQSLLRKVIRMVVSAGAIEALEKGRSNWINLALAGKPEQAEVLSEVAGALSDRKAKITHHALLIDYETGKGETPEHAAVRLIRAAVFHNNKVIAASYRIHRDALVKAGVISVEKAKEATDAARKERDVFAKKAAEARKTTEPLSKKDDKKKEDKKKAA